MKKIFKYEHLFPLISKTENYIIYQHFYWQQNISKYLRVQPQNPDQVYFKLGRLFLRLSFHQITKVLVVQSCLTLCNPMDEATKLLCPWNSPGKNTGVHSHSLLQRIFPTQRSNSDLMHCRQILYPLSYEATAEFKTRRRRPSLCF